MNNTSSTSFAIPVAIVLAGMFIGMAIYFSGGSGAGSTTAQPELDEAVLAQQQQELRKLDQVRPVDHTDHILGNPNASVVVVEYTDFECPFCKQFHDTMKRIMNEYGPTGQVAWVLRHFPLESIHSKARTEAHAAECAAELGGNDAFWAFADEFYKRTPSNDLTDLSILPEIAEEIGLNVDQFDACMVSERHMARVDRDIENARATGADGTPWSIVITRSGERFPINGAPPYLAVKQLIELSLQH